MNYYDGITKGFYLEQNENKTRYEITDEYWQELLDLQSQGKEITTDKNGNPIAIDHIITPQELAKKELYEIEQWFERYDLQVKQYQRCVRLNIEFDKDIAELDLEAKKYQERLKMLRNN